MHWSICCLLFLFRFTIVIGNSESENIVDYEDGVTSAPISVEDSAEDDLQRDNGTSCLLDVNLDLPRKNEPLLLSLNNSTEITLVLPELKEDKGVIALSEGEEILVTCPGHENYIGVTKEQMSTATCTSGTTLSINGKDRKFLDLDCNSRAEATAKVTSKACVRGRGAIVEIGFEAGGWTKLIETCHNFAQSSTYYSMHTLYGSRLPARIHVRTGRPYYAKGDYPLFQGVNPDVAYTQRNQEILFSRLLGENTTSELLDKSSGRFLVRGHLAPDADFLLSPHQLLTFTYVNVAPQWQSINSGNWLKLEEDTRRIAAALEADFQIVTGTLGVLRMTGEKGPTKIAFHSWKLPVPEFFWKILRNMEDDSCIVFMSSNNPFAKQKPRKLCRDVCEKFYWPVYQDDFAKGYIYCCEYAYIKKIVRDIPVLQCTSTLSGEAL